MRSLLILAAAALATAVPALRETQQVLHHAEADAAVGGYGYLCKGSNIGKCPHMMAWFSIDGTLVAPEDGGKYPKSVGSGNFFSFSADYESTTVNGAPAIKKPILSLWQAAPTGGYNMALWSVDKDAPPTWRMSIDAAAGVPPAFKCKGHALAFGKDFVPGGREPREGWCPNEKPEDECHCLPVRGFTKDGKAFATVLRFHMPDAWRDEMKKAFVKLLTERAQCFKDASGADPVTPSCANFVPKSRDSLMETPEHKKYTSS